MTLDLAILIACAAIAICMRIFKPNLIIETLASTVMIVMLVFYPIARGFDKMDGVNWIFFALLMTLSLILHVINVFLLAEKKN
jgi:hypothetical protein